MFESEAYVSRMFFHSESSEKERAKTSGRPLYVSSARHGTNIKGGREEFEGWSLQLSLMGTFAILTHGAWELEVFRVMRTCWEWCSLCLLGFTVDADVE